MVRIAKGKRVAKNCPDCGKLMVIRQNRQNSSWFLGCSQYPECTHTEALPETLKMLAMGAQMLPGIE